MTLMFPTVMVIPVIMMVVSTAIVHRDDATGPQGHQRKQA